MDPHSEERLSQVHPETSRRIHQLESMLSFALVVTQGLRTYPQQDSLWDQGRTTPGAPCVHGDASFPAGQCPTGAHPFGLPVTKAKGGQSMHNFGFPVDVGPSDGHGGIDWNGKDDKWMEILNKAPSCGLAEGAQWRTFPDEPHLYPQEVPAEPDDEMRQLFMDGGLDAVWAKYLPVSS